MWTLRGRFWGICATLFQRLNLFFSPFSQICEMVMLGRLVRIKAMSTSSLNYIQEEIYQGKNRVVTAKRLSTSAAIELHSRKQKILDRILHKVMRSHFILFSQFISFYSLIMPSRRHPMEYKVCIDSFALHILYSIGYHIFQKIFQMKG